MLRLEPLVSLEKDVFPKIPREHLLVPPKLAPRSSTEASASTWLNYKGAALSIIGRYNSDTLILSYIGFYEVRRLEVLEGRFGPFPARRNFADSPCASCLQESRTAFFATYDVAQATLRVVYRQRAVLMVACTLNVQGSLIGMCLSSFYQHLFGIWNATNTHYV